MILSLPHHSQCMSCKHISARNSYLFTSDWLRGWVQQYIRKYDDFFFGQIICFWFGVCFRLCLRKRDNAPSLSIWLTLKICWLFFVLLVHSLKLVILLWYWHRVRVRLYDVVSKNQCAKKRSLSQTVTSHGVLFAVVAVVCVRFFSLSLFLFLLLLFACDFVSSTFFVPFETLARALFAAGAFCYLLS